MTIKSKWINLLKRTEGTNWGILLSVSNIRQTDVNKTIKSIKCYIFSMKYI